MNFSYEQIMKLVDGIEFIIKREPKFMRIPLENFNSLVFLRNKPIVRSLSIFTGHFVKWSICFRIKYNVSIAHGTILIPIPLASKSALSEEEKADKGSDPIHQSQFHFRFLTPLNPSQNTIHVKVYFVGRLLSTYDDGDVNPNLDSCQDQHCKQREQGRSDRLLHYPQCNNQMTKRCHQGQYKWNCKSRHFLADYIWTVPCVRAVDDEAGDTPDTEYYQ